MSKLNMSGVACVLVAVVLGNAGPAGAGGLGEPLVEPTEEPCLSYGNLSPVTIGVFGGTERGTGYGGLNATVSTTAFGDRALQFDAEISRTGDKTFGSLAGHVALVERDNGMAGVYASASKYQDADTVWRLGGEVYADFDRVSFAAVAGWQSAGTDNAFVQADIGLALGDASRLIFGVAYDDGGSAKLRLEHDFGGANAAGPTTVYIEGTTYQDGGDRLALGVNFIMGGKSSTYCPPEAKTAAKPGAKFRSWSTPRKLPQSTPAATSTRACTETDVPGLVLDGACVYSIGGSVVDGDVTGCFVATSACA